MRSEPSSQPTPLGGILLRVLDKDPGQRPLWLRWGAAVLLTVLALWLRLQIGPVDSGARFVTLSLATVLAGLFGGFSAGLISALLGVGLVNWLLMQPGDRPIELMEWFWLNASFAVTQIVIVGAIWVMQQRNRHLQALTHELTASQKKFVNTFEHAAAGITHVGLNGELLAVNQTFCNLVGYNESELMRMRFQDLTHGEDLAHSIELMQDAVSGLRTHYTFEKRYVHRDGHAIWSQLTVALVRRPDGTPDYFITVVQDVSKAKITETALRTSERLMQQAQAIAGLLSWAIDLAEGRFQTFGNFYLKLGLPSPEFGTQDILQLTHPDDHQRIQQEWTQAIKGRGNFKGSYRGHPDTPIQWFSARAEFERDERGHALRAYGISQDISARKLAELKIQQLNTSLELRIEERTAELKDAYNELESYSYAVAHDLRSPLRIINGFAQALQDDNPSLNTSSKNHIHRIKNASQKMGLLIDGLLKLSQYSRGQVERHPVSLSGVALQVLKELAADEPTRQVEWSVEPELIVQADPPLIEALMENLLHNAWKYSMNTPQAQIRVYREFDPEGQAHYCVADNGAGFDMARAEKLFQPFQRLHMPHEFAGLGVGLATARRIVLRHGGELNGQAEPGKGARFCFTLPTDVRHAKVF